MRRKPKINYSERRDGDREDFDIICSLRKQKNGEKFSKLYDHGDWLDCSYGSQSEADAGLCSMIAFRTGRDPEAIDRLFRESALYRPKWDRNNYRAIQLASQSKAVMVTFTVLRWIIRLLSGLTITDRHMS